MFIFFCAFILFSLCVHPIHKLFRNSFTVSWFLLLLVLLVTISEIGDNICNRYVKRTPLGAIYNVLRGRRKMATNLNENIDNSNRTKHKQTTEKNRREEKRECYYDATSESCV